MPSPTASARPGLAHRIAVLALNGVAPLEVGIPFQVFDRRDLPYDVTLCGRDAGSIATDSGWTVNATHALDAVIAADTVIVPAFRDFLAEPPDDVAAALREANRRGARIASICTAAFALASAGLLDGRRATTHWRRTDELARRYPNVAVDPAALYIDDGDIITSAGVASGIDLCLYLLRRDHGAAIANAVARDLVASPHREGGQAQFIARPSVATARTGLGETLEWALTSLDKPLAVADLAAHASRSARSFARIFTDEMGTSPIKWLNAARVDQARELLETTDLTVDDIAVRCGLGTPANFRRHFRRATGTTPSSYRRMFAGT
ncbi:GlxA family transcriptional regulator [Amycolatopsis jejuensis]|uniref:GlxA family transcriptional regulator n=1 Tax=Amycolatopsis jejuensis TaxID=330084 RepID=UPI000690AB52|nr:helix-turn-helix domain-containing protein [Amycolatopsis jejuensis]